MVVIPARRALLEALRAEGVGHLFGNPGSTEVPMLDALVDYPDIEYVLTAHEHVAICMADGFARSTGRPAVASVHATPGVANSLGGLFNARATNTPLVLLAGQPDSRILMRRPFLASDLVETVRQHTKWAWQVQRAEELIPALRRAFKVATQPPAGPVLLALPRDAMYSDVEFDVTSYRPQRISRRLRPDADDVRRAAELIVGARTPVLLAGNEAARSGAIEQLVELAELIGARVYSEHNVTDMHFPSQHPLYLGGNSFGTGIFKEWLKEADVLVAVGCDLFMESAYDPEPIIPPGCQVIQVNLDPEDLGRIYPAVVAMVADPALAAGELVASVRERLSEEDAQRIASRRSDVHGLRRQRDDTLARLREAEWSREPIRATRVYAELRQAMAPGDVLVDEAISMAQYLYDFFELTEPGTLFSSKPGHLGWGLPAALGVKLAQPDRRVVAAVGDGSAMFAIQALWTAQRYQIDITLLVFNNRGYIAEKDHLRNFAGRALETGIYIGAELGDVDFAAIAAGFGVAGERVLDPDQIAPALARSFASSGPYVLDVRIDPTDAGYRRQPVPA